MCVIKGVPVQSCETALRSDLDVHRSDLSSLILPHPQLSVFDGIHTLQQFVHWLHRLVGEGTAASQSSTG